MAYPYILLLFLSMVQVIFASELYFDRVELLNSSYVKGLYNVSQYRIAKFNRTTYVFNSDVEFFYDTDRNHTIAVEFFYNRLNNNQYSKTIIRVAKTSICDIVDRFAGTLRAVDSEQFQSNFPKLKPGEKYCPFKKGRYWVKNYAFDGNKLPPIFTTGHWRGEFTVAYNDMIVWLVHVYFKIVGPFGL